MNAEKEPDKGFKLRLVEMVLGALIAISLAVSSWTVKRVVLHGELLTKLQASNLTVEQGMLLWKEIAAIRERIAALPNEFPPKWFGDRVALLEARMDKVDAKLSLNGESLIRIQTTLDRLERKP